MENKNASVQRAVWRQSGCLLADSVVVILNFTARRNVSEPPPERQAARTLEAILGDPALANCSDVKKTKLGKRNRTGKAKV